MPRRRLAGLVTIALTSILCLDAFGADMAPDELAKKVFDTYQKLETYKSEGTVVTDITARGTRVKTETVFSILLKKPNLYRISWTQNHASMPALSQSGTVWNDGKQSRLHMSAANAYYEFDDDSMAIASATGISSGVAHNIASLFLPAFAGTPNHFFRIQDLTMEQSEMIAGEKCYVLSSSSDAVKKETFWISQATHLIRKYRHTLEPRDEDAMIPEMTDEQIDQAIKTTGGEATDEARQNMRLMLENARKTLKDAKLKGSFVEFHATVSSPELDPQDFEFVPPKGTVLKKSLLGDSLDGK